MEKSNLSFASAMTELALMLAAKVASVEFAEKWLKEDRQRRDQGDAKK
jgi:hypothetical protein